MTTFCQKCPVKTPALNITMATMAKIAIGINLAISTIALITAAPSTPRITSAVNDHETTETTMTDKKVKEPSSLAKTPGKK